MKYFYKVSKYFCVPALLILSSLFIYTQHLPFNFEWINTDFAGTAFNDKAIVAYGDHGIITYSLDRGGSWKQINIGTVQSIKKIIAYENVFWGITDYAVLRSEDGANWKLMFLQDSPTYKYIVNKENYLYILTDKDIKVIDVKENSLELKKEIDLETGYLYKQIDSDSNNLYILNDVKLYKYNFQDSLQQIKSLASPLLKAQVKVINNRLYFIEEDESGEEYRVSISSNEGKNWIYNNLSLESGLIFEKDSIMHYIIADSYIDTSDIAVNYLMTPRIWKIQDGIKISPSEYKQPERMIESQPKNSFLGLIQISSDTLIAVGKNKLIALSYDGGVNWQVKSIFNLNQRFPIQKVNKNLLYINDSLQYCVDLSHCMIYRTWNSGATWLPQKYNSNNTFEIIFNSNQYSPGIINNYYYNDKGEGYVKYKTKSQKDTNTAFSEDSGETYVKIGNSSSPPNHANIFNEEAIETKNYAIYHYYYKDSLTGSNNFEIARLDKNFNLVDTIKLPEQFMHIIKTSDTKLIALYNKQWGSNYSQTGDFKDYYNKYTLWESNDEGKNWDSIDINVPFYRKKIKSGNGFMLTDANKKVLVIEDHLIFISGHNTYIYDINKKQFDSLNLILKSDTNFGTVFKVDSTYFIACATQSNDNDYLYYSNNLFESNPKIDSVDYNKAFFCEGYKIINSKMIDDIAYLLIGFYSNDTQGSNYKLNFIKINEKNQVNTIESPKKIDYYLWATLPYPNPGRNAIQAKLYWSSDLNNEALGLDVFNYLGDKVNAYVTFERINDNSGLITLYPDDLPKGVYMIMAKKKSSQINIRVVIE